MTFGKSKEEADKTVTEIAEILAKNRHTGMSERIIERFVRFWNAKKRIIEVEIVSRRELSREILDEIAKDIKEKHKAEKVILKEKVDEKIKGGIIMRLGDDVLDTSVSSRLRSLRNFLRK